MERPQRFRAQITGPSEAIEVRFDQGFTLVETVVVLLIWSIAAAVALPDIMALYDWAALQDTAAQTVSDLRTQQLRAEDFGRYQEVRFAPEQGWYVLYGDVVGVERFRLFVWPTAYFEGYVHLPEPTVRFDIYGTVSESGQIGFVSPTGRVADIILYMQYGELRLASHMESS